MKYRYKRILTNYHKACEAIKDEFIEVYYIECATKSIQVENYWIADEVGGVCFINDYFWDLATMVEALKCGPTPDQLFKWYEDRQEKRQLNITLKNYLKLTKSNQ